MISVVAFPYNPDIEIVLKYKEWLVNYEIIGVLSYKEDISLLNRLHNRYGVEITQNDELWERCDKLLILSNYREYKTEKYYQIIEEALKRNIQICISPDVLMQIDLKKYDGVYEVLENRVNISKTEIDIQKRKSYVAESVLFDIDIPIIAVMGMGKNAGKFETQLLLKQILTENYNVAMVSSNALGTLFGCYSLPPFLFEDSNIENKIVNLNYHIKEISKDESIDAIVLGVPEGLLPFKKGDLNHFGEYAIVTSYAAPPDITFFCTYYFEEGMTDDSLKAVEKLVEQRLDLCNVKAVISNTIFEVSSEEKSVIYVHLDMDNKNENLLDLETDLFLDAIKLRDKQDAILKLNDYLGILVENPLTV